MSIIVTGHKNPDTDSIASAIAATALLQGLGIEATACAQGAPAPETAFALEHFGLEAPKIIDDVSGKRVILVDHSDLGQAPKGIGEAELLCVIDHHKLGDITTTKPLFMWVWPVGCSCTVIKNIFDFYKVEIPVKIAGIMLSAILSDTVIFKSPTTTPTDIKAVEELAAIIGISDSDYKAFGMKLFKVKSAVEGVPPRELIFRDFKDFEMNGHKIGIGQLELISLSMVDNMKEDLYKELVKIKEEGRNSALLLLTDIMQEGSELLAISDTPDFIYKAFGVKEEKFAWLKGVMSRKKDVVPQLEASFKNA